MMLPFLLCEHFRYLEWHTRRISYEVSKVAAMVRTTKFCLHKLHDEVRQSPQCTVLMICTAGSSTDGDIISFIT